MVEQGFHKSELRAAKPVRICVHLKVASFLFPGAILVLYVFFFHSVKLWCLDFYRNSSPGPLFACGSSPALLHEQDGYSNAIR